jgi:sorbitol/mannitol transport system substrate-binding protein
LLGAYAPAEVQDLSLRRRRGDGNTELKITPEEISNEPEAHACPVTGHCHHMIEMQKLTPQFEKVYPDIKLKWVTLEEAVLRQRVTTDIATKGSST